MVAIDLDAGVGAGHRGGLQVDERRRGDAEEDVLVLEQGRITPSVPARPVSGAPTAPPRPHSGQNAFGWGRGSAAAPCPPHLWGLASLRMVRDPGAMDRAGDWPAPASHAPRDSDGTGLPGNVLKSGSLR